jgi:ribosomal protein S6--L-glutamate ligase
VQYGFVTVSPTLSGNALLRKSKRIIKDNDALRQQYHQLDQGDLVLGRIRVKATEEQLLLDLAVRGIELFPSALSQLASRSKTFQTLLFSPHMVPHTRAVHDSHDLLETMNHLHQHGIGRVVTKQDRRNAGQGIHLWDSVENLYTQASLGMLPYPFVLQPFHPGCHDIRVIVLGEYREAYQRSNPDNFRNNLHMGGKSSPCTLSESQWTLCLRVMERGQFPYAHLDLIVLPSGETYVTEINLRGGIKGARITPREYRERVAQIQEAAERGEGKTR